MTQAAFTFLNHLGSRLRIVTVPGFGPTMAYLTHLRTLCLVDCASLAAMVASIPQAVWLSAGLTIELAALMEWSLLAVRRRAA